MQHESWYFSFIPASTSRRNRQQGTDILSPGSLEPRVGSPGPLSPGPFSPVPFSPARPLTPPSGHASNYTSKHASHHASSRASPSTSSLQLSDIQHSTSDSPKSRRIAVSTLPQSRRNKAKYNVEEDETPLDPPDIRHRLGTASSTSSLASLAEEHRGYSQRQSPNDLREHPNRDSVSSIESVRSDDSPKDVTTSKSRKPQGMVAKGPPLDYFASSLRASDFNDDVGADLFTGLSPKALKRLGIGVEDATTPKPLASSSGHNIVIDNVKSPVYREHRSPSSSSASSSENPSPESPKEGSRRPSFWKSLSPSHIKASRTREKAKGMKIEITNPALSFLHTEVPLATARPIIGDSPIGISQSNSSHCSISLSCPSRICVSRGAGGEDLEKEQNQNVFRERVLTGSEEDADKYLDVPEHLPTSPLCPRHPKHRSKGTGFCQYHGRN